MDRECLMVARREGQFGGMGEQVTGLRIQTDGQRIAMEM